MKPRVGNAGFPPGRPYAADLDVGRALKKRDSIKASAIDQPLLTRRNKHLLLLVGCFWIFFLTLAMIFHVTEPPSPLTQKTHGYEHFTLQTKTNFALADKTVQFERIASFRICCVMPGGQMECPDARELECHLLRDEGPRLTCYWIAPRLIDARCKLYWVTL